MSVAVEKNGNGTFLNSLECIPCPQNIDYDFLASKGKNLSIGNCLLSNHFSESYSSVLNFQTGNITSYYFQVNLMPTFFSCKVNLFQLLYITFNF